MLVLYKIKDPKAGGAYCDACGKWSPKPVWIGFEDGTEGSYGANCAKKYLIVKMGTIYKGKSGE